MATMKLVHKGKPIVLSTPSDTRTMLDVGIVSGARVMLIGVSCMLVLFTVPKWFWLLSICCNVGHLLVILAPGHG